MSETHNFFIIYVMTNLCNVESVLLFLRIRRPPRSTRTDTLFPYTTLFRSRPHQGGRGRQLRLPAVHPAELPHPRGRSRRGLQPGAGHRHPCRRQGPRGTARGPAHQRDGHRRVHGTVDPELPRTTAADEPLEQRGARSEEHTSELQYLIRTSNAVYC